MTARLARLSLLPPGDLAARCRQYELWWAERPWTMEARDMLELVALRAVVAEAGINPWMMEATA